MNKNRHRVVFSAARGLRMVVAENARSLGRASTGATAAILITASLLPAQAQIVADPSAPGRQRPTVLSAPNGVPLVNIQTPSAAGVSRNTYRQFDVNGPGAILNNSRTHVQTQLGGWVPGNPWLATGSARIILNEVNSTNPSYLNGPIEVAGQRAEVIIANPAGIQVNGGSFINASGVTLTTGTPVMNEGSLESFRVRGGQVQVNGLGLDARGADHATIFARAMEVNAAIWATVNAQTVQVDVGGDLKVQSRQDTSTFKSDQESSGWGVSLCIPPICYGASSVSASGAAQNIESDFASVREQSGIKAGDGGFQVSVKGDTALIGGAITSSNMAVQDNKNTFDTGGELTLSDVKNHAEYKASGYAISASVAVGGATPDKDETLTPEQQAKQKAEQEKKAPAAPAKTEGSAGIGEDSGRAESTTTSAISGIAGNKDARTGDAETGIQPIFDKTRVQKEIDAQIKITAEFGKAASKAIGDYAGKQMKDATKLREQARLETDPSKQAELQARADQLESDWGDNGTLRVLAHTIVGGLTGGAAGAAGSLAGTLAAPAVADALAKAGIDGALASTITALASTAAGAIAGGTTGAATAINEVMNNYLKHQDVNKLAEKLKTCGNDKACRDDAFDEAYRKSVANDVELLNCKTTNNCEELKAEYRRGYTAVEGMLDMGIKPDDVSLILNMETNAQTIIRNGLDQIQCGTAACVDKANHLVGIGKGLAKVTHAGLVTGSGLATYELTTALLNQGLTDTAVALAQGVAGLPADLKQRLSSNDPQVRGEALVDALAIGTVATVVTTKLGQAGYRLAVRSVEAQRGSTGELTGTRTAISANDDAATFRSLTRENESATMLANNGYKVEQNPPTLPNGKNPDYIINGQVFDNYAPATGNVRNAADVIGRKVAAGQADNVVVNLADSSITPAALTRQLTSYPIPGLKQVIIVGKTGAPIVINFLEK